MKSFWCGAVVPDCTATFQGKTEQEILEQVSAHAAADHGLTDIPSDVLAQVRGSIVNVSGT